MYVIKYEINLDELEKIENKCFPTSSYSRTQLKEILDDHRLYSIICVHENTQIVGYIMVLDNGDSLEIMKIGTLPEYRNRGLGSFLIDEVSKKRREIFLEVRERNLTAISFYLKNGFNKVGKRKNYYEDTGEAAIIMVKN